MPIGVRAARWGDYPGGWFFGVADGCVLVLGAEKRGPDMLMRQLSAIAVGLGISIAVLLVLGVELPGVGGGSAELSPLQSSGAGLGERVYNSNCAGCHGVSGEGQPDWQQRGANGALPPPPHDSSGHTWHHADGLLFRIIQQGGVLYSGPTTPSGMPGFGEQLSDGEIRAVVGYLKTFWGAEERAFQAEVSLADPLP